MFWPCLANPVRAAGWSGSFISVCLLSGSLLIILSRRKLRDVSQTKQMEALLADCPAWMRWAIRTVFVYAIVNFLLFMATTTATPK